MSSTVAKALTLLDYFSEDTPEVGLSELARRSGLDKATVHRMMGSMADAGIVEQRGDTRLYRLGPGLLRLARIREAAFPIASIVQPALEDLSARTGETAHASLISGRVLATIGICESHKGSRVSLKAGELLPFHSTASGLTAVAFASPELRNRVFGAPLVAKTRFTVTDLPTLQARIEIVRQTGFAEADQTNEEDVYGTAAPMFDRDGLACGAIAVATPSHRMSEQLRRQIIVETLEAARAVTTSTGGRLPKNHPDIVRRALVQLGIASD
jgi:DNA-binding IclR family transcriptional regulator